MLEMRILACWLVLLAILLFESRGEIVEAKQQQDVEQVSKPLTDDAGSFCYDNCSNHGKCVKNICKCDPGWYGENCATKFGAVPLSVGSKNITSIQMLNELLTKNEAVFIGISTTSCAKCGLVEEEYAKTNFSDVVFARIDSSTHADVIASLGVVDPSLPLPLLVFSWNKGKSRALYRGSHTANTLSRFCELKGKSPGYIEWNEPQSPPSLTGFTGAIIAAYFPVSKGKSIDKDTDEWEEFVSTASSLRSRHDMAIFMLKVDPSLQVRPSWFPPKTMPLPAIGVAPSTLLSNTEDWKFTTLTEEPQLVNTRVSIAHWLALMSVANAAPLSYESFSAMEELGLPMLMLFSPSTQLLHPVLPAFRDAAREYRGRVTFLYDEKGDFQDKMTVLGLENRKDRLSMAMNTRDVGPVPFMEEVTSESFRRFCADFLSGRFKPLSAMTQKKPEKQDQPAAASDDSSEDVPGVSESFRSTDVGIVDATHDWSKVALDETSDVVLFIYRSKGCLACKQLAPYFKKVARRFLDLKQTTTKNHRIVCARLDLDLFRPNDIAADTHVPAIIMLPAFNKKPPFQYFSAVAKVFTIMEWARTSAARKFEWGEELPQFDAKEKQLFREQIKMREEARRQRNEKSEL